ncbi:helix-turn-helix domain-containing protein [Streptomyces sp. NPDC050481]|uniref:helix-turn-helix domain-containing protein n=1 Tax=Streptomyces sp. NPDC050481 TaxID=3365616 RepID=UPI0037AB5AAC
MLGEEDAHSGQHASVAGHAEGDDPSGHGGRQYATVPIALLMPGDSPRSQGQDVEHVARLAEIEQPLPPILVNRRTMQVIDGMHRLLAALSTGRETIEVQFFDGTVEEAFLRSVAENMDHGLPLSRADRRAAAERVIISHPHMSDRAIALTAGLGAKSVAAIRRRLSEALPQLNVRVGRDGRARPVGSVEGRLRAARLLAEQPGASLRQVARIAGISPATVSDVRRRLASGDPPAGHLPPVADADGAKDVRTASVRSARERTRPRPLPDPSQLLVKVLRDPSLRQREEGRHLLRLLQQNAVLERQRTALSDAVPSHCGSLVVELARQCADKWLEFAQELDERVQEITRA